MSTLEPRDNLDVFASWISSHLQTIGIGLAVMLFGGALAIYLYIAVTQEPVDVPLIVSLESGVDVIFTHKSSVLVGGESEFRVRIFPRTDSVDQRIINVRIIENSPEYTLLQQPFDKVYRINSSKEEIRDHANFSVGSPSWNVGALNFILEVGDANKTLKRIPYDVKVQRLTTSMPIGVGISAILIFLITTLGHRLFGIITSRLFPNSSLESDRNV